MSCRSSGRVLNTMMKTLCFLPVFLLLLAGGAHAQTSFFTHLGSMTPEKITMISDWDSMATIKDNTSWDARILITGENLNEEWKAELAVRGRFRRAKCTFPPLEINLKKGALRERGFAEFDKLKVVTHCNNENPDPVDLYEELLIYQLYALMTSYSFKALPLRIDYLYPNGKTFAKNAVALVLEPTSEVVHRLGVQELELFGAIADSLNAESYCRNALFQFMIGNFDWDHLMQRNVKMIGTAGNYHLIPYDFDFSAIVSPPYARMPGDYGLKDFRDRVYLGQYFAEQLPMTIQEFDSKKSMLFAHIEAYPYLSKTRRREIITYLEHFYDYIMNPATVISYKTVLPCQQ